MKYNCLSLGVGQGLGYINTSKEREETRLAKTEREQVFVFLLMH